MIHLTLITKQSPKAEKLLYNGAKIYQNFFRNEENAVKDEITAVYDSKMNLIGLYTLLFDEDKNEAYIKPATMLM